MPANALRVLARASRDAAKDQEDPNVSPVATARHNTLGLSKSSFSRICMLEKLHPYKMIRCQKLEALDYPRRARMC